MGKLGRIRTVKPEFFKHSGLYDLEKETGLPIRIAFAGLWTCCDREGRFKWKPRELKTDVLPHDECDFAKVLDSMVSAGFVIKYSVNGESFGAVPTFKEHQHVNLRESCSTIPPPDTVTHVRTRGERKGKEGKGKGKEGDIARSVPPEELAGTLPLVDGSDFPISKTQVKQWTEAFPAIDVKEKLRQAKVWLEANPTRKKTRRGVMRFIVAWLDRAQNNGGGNGRQDQRGNQGNAGAEGGEDGPDLYAALYGPVEQGKLN